jgi:hypothetical protein
MHVLPTLESPKTKILYVAAKSSAIFYYRFHIVVSTPDAQQLIFNQSERKRTSRLLHLYGLINLDCLPQHFKFGDSTQSVRANNNHKICNF